MAFSGYFLGANGRAYCLLGNFVPELLAPFSPLPVKFAIKLPIFGELSWRWYFSSFGPGSAISQKLAKKKSLSSAE
jgi:hypothetical protein